MDGVIAFSTIVALLFISEASVVRYELAQRARRIMRRILPPHWEQWGDISVRVAFGYIKAAQMLTHDGRVKHLWVAA